MMFRYCSEGPRYDAGFRVTQGSGFALFGMENINWHFCFPVCYYLGSCSRRQWLFRLQCFLLWLRLAQAGRGWAGLGEAWARPGRGLVSDE